MTMHFSTLINYGRKTDHESAVGLGDFTIKEAVASTIKHLKYYLELEPGMKIGDVEIRQACAACDGNGSIKTKRTVKTCKTCKGEGYPKVLFSMKGTLSLPINPQS